MYIREALQKEINRLKESQLHIRNLQEQKKDGLYGASQLRATEVMCNSLSRILKDLK